MKRRNSEAAKVIQRMLKRSKGMQPISDTDPISLDKSEAAQMIQRTFKRFKRMQPINDTDPISLDAFEKGKPYFKLVAPNGCVSQYDALNLASFFTSTGTWVDPFSNTKLHEAEIWRLQKFVLDHHGARFDLLSAFNDPKYKEMERFREQALTDLDDVCADLIAESLDLIDDIDCTRHEFTDLVKGRNRIFDQFDDYFNQMRSHDLDFALQATLKYITTVKGDPKHPRCRSNRKWIFLMDHLFDKIIGDIYK